MKATFEPLAQVHLIRLHPSDDAVHGDAYVAHTTAVFDGPVATLRGFAMDGYSTAAWRAIEAELHRLGAREVVFARRRGGSERVVRVTVRG